MTACSGIIAAGVWRRNETNRTGRAERPQMRRNGRQIAVASFIRSTKIDFSRQRALSWVGGPLSAYRHRRWYSRRSCCWPARLASRGNAARWT